ncbi:hypothetical protein CRX42_00570 [Pseudomonas jessenii]|uniref:O-antigen ligase-related domain-containing protein n=2 Tax=Pseudomonas jessenii TaxID=77298 RepID=A0A2W0EXJ4_PSEJE|nr:hypothetical protein CRX42_00570 [Pseudomonas jessenii]
MLYLLAVMGLALILYFFRAAVLLLPVWTTLTPKALLLVDTPSIPAISLYKFYCLALIGSYFLRVMCHKKRKVYKKPFSRAFVALLVPSIISVMLNITSNNAGILTLTAFFIEVIMPTTIFCHYLSQAPLDKLHSLVKKYIVFYCALATYGTICYLIGHNPYIEFIQSTNHTDRILAQTYEETLRGARAQGTISHPITYGALLVITLLTYLTIKLNKRRFAIADYVKIATVTAIILSGILFTNSRSPLILFIVPIVIFATMQGFVKAFKSALGITLVFVIAFSASEVVRDKTYSVINIFNPEVGEDMKGSDLAMRGGQLNVATRYFFESPIWGMGLDATRNIISSGKEPDLYNSESIIFRLLIDQGALGILSYTLFFIVLYRKTTHHISNIASKRMYLGTIIGYIIFIISTGFVDTLQNTIFMLCITYYIFRADRIVTRLNFAAQTTQLDKSQEKQLDPLPTYTNSDAWIGARP